jgi:hypothetical protein
MVCSLYICKDKWVVSKVLFSILWFQKFGDLKKKEKQLKRNYAKKTFCCHNAKHGPTPKRKNAC